MKSKIIFLVMALAVSASFILSACGAFTTGGTTASASYSYLSMAINPSIDFLLDEDDKIIDLIPVNEDGAILSHEIKEAVLGESISEAINIIFEEGIRLGFIDVDASEENPSAVIISAINDLGFGRPEELISGVKSKIDEYFSDNGIFGRSLVADDVLEGIDRTLARNRAADLVAKISELHSDRESLEDESIADLISSIRDEVQNWERPFNPSEIASQRNQRQSTFADDFNTWSSERDNISQSIRNQIKAFQEDDDIDAKDWAPGLRNFIRNRFDVEDEESEVDESETIE